MSDDQSPQDDPGAIEGEPAPIVEAETQEGQDGEASPFPDPDSPEGAGENPPEGAETPGDGGPGDVHDADGADGVAPEDPAPVEVLPPVGDSAPGKKKDRPKKTPGRMTDADLAVIELREIRDAAHEVDSLFSALEEARAETKEAKANEKEIQKRWEAAVVRQQQIIRGEKVMPLFANTPDIGDDEEDEEDDEPKPAKPPKASKGKGKKDRPPGSDPEWESWHDVRLDSIGLPQNVTDKLSTANFDTIGELTKWQRMSPKNTLDKIPGIGEATSEKIADALLAFYRDNPQYTVVPSDDTVADEPAEPAQEHGSKPPAEEASAVEDSAAESVVMPGDVPEESIPNDVPPPDVEVEAKPKKKKSKKG